jgi:predicted ATPase/class 3 adenylate cyclase
MDHPVGRYVVLLETAHAMKVFVGDWFQPAQDDLSDTVDTCAMLVQRLPVDPREVLIWLAVRPREERGQLSGVVAQLQDLSGHPVGLDQGDVVQQRANAVEGRIGVPIDHLWADVLELTQRVAPTVLEGSQPTANLRIVRDWLESQAFLHWAKLLFVHMPAETTYSTYKQPDLPSGTVTFLFTDIEGSTRLLQELGDGYAEVLANHRRTLRDAWQRHNGVEVDTQGDAFFVAFARASDAVAAAAEAQRAMAAGPVRVRIGLHTGEPVRAGEGYVGYDVHRAARIAAAGHGGQVLLSQATADLAGLEVRDLGLHRLKDLSAPERIFQLGTSEFPPLNTLHESNLPIPATPFLGREHEVGHIAALLRRAAVRLVTLTGPGGSGKTRLALQAAAAAADDYDQGVWWVPLASLTDPELVETAASQALGSKDTLAAAVGDKRLLLVLDNFEHLLDAAAGVAGTLSLCPRLTVLVTSREPLHVDGEWEVAVDPMHEQEAVDLFVQRALAVKSDFVANGEVPKICSRLDFLPLAIELAAARVKALPPSVLLERLELRLPVLAGGSRSAPERQRTLRATIAWSHDLLQREEQDVFARLAVFAGGCTLDAAQEICAADFDAIASLVDKSLLRRTGDRYSMLETIREFAAERLDQLGDADEVRDRHATYYVSLAERARPELRGREATTWLDRLDAEHANVRVAFTRLLERRDAQGALRLSGAIWPYWQTRGHWTEGRRLLNAAVVLGDHQRVEPERLVDSLWGGSFLALWQGDVLEGEGLASRILEISTTTAEQEHVYAVAIHLLAIVATRRGNLDQALAWLEESVEIGRGGGDSWLLSVALNNLGDLLMRKGDYARAVPFFEESLAVGESRGDLDRRARAFNNLGQATKGLGDLAGGGDYYRRGLRTATEIGLVDVQLWSLLGIALLEAEAGDPVVGARVLGRSIELALRLGAADEHDVLAVERKARSRLEAALGREKVASELSVGSSMSLDDAIALALGSEHVGDERVSR